VNDDWKVSIVLPTHNGSRYIRQSIESCLSQTHKNIELIVVDDGSTDNTPEIVRSYGGRLICIKHDTNLGLPTALNSGFARSTGEYLTWTSDDNYYHPEAIEKMITFLKQRNGSFVYCDYFRFSQNNPEKFKQQKLPDTPNFERGNDVGACFLYARKVMQTVGLYDSEAILAEDFDYWIRTSMKFKMHHLNEFLYYYREHPTSLSSLARKSYRVRIASILVMLKNGVIDDRTAIRLFDKNISQPIWLSKHEFLMSNTASRFLGRNVAKIIAIKLPEKECISLERFRSGEINHADLLRILEKFVDETLSSQD